MNIDRRHFFKKTCQVGALASVTPAMMGNSPHNNNSQSLKPEGSQRLKVSQLEEWENLHYGMFIHFGMSTFLGQELPDGKAPANTYAPDKLDVNQWISVARDAGMKYAVLTTKHVAGHCLWPSQHTKYNVANSGNKTDVVEKFVLACEQRGVKPGFYYCSWDNHNRFGSQTPSDGGWEGMNSFPKEQLAKAPPFTTSLYHNFQTAQITELLTTYGPIMVMWIDIPGVLGRGYRTFLYNHIASLQSDIIIMMNSGFGDGTRYNVDYAFPSDLIAIERDRPPRDGHVKWRTIEGKSYYLPAEHNDPIGKEWFYVNGDPPRPDNELLEQFEQTREREVNFLLNVPPDKHGLIPTEHINALKRLRKNAKL